MIKKMKVSYYVSIILLISIILFIIFIRPHIFYPKNIINFTDYVLWGTDFKVIDNFKKIKVGMKEDDVIRILGKPKLVDTDKILIQYHGDLSQYKKGIDNPNKAFWYRTGIDYQICIIFDKNNNVIYVNEGGT